MELTFQKSSFSLDRGTCRLGIKATYLGSGLKW
jgi:hypothetical protein